MGLIFVVKTEVSVVAVKGFLTRANTANTTLLAVIDKLR
jgi:hypothetical protein